MRISRLLASVAGAAMALLAAGVTPVLAQGVTTGAIGGTVTGSSGEPLENVQIQVVNRETGGTAGALSRANGRYFVQNLEVGGRYAVVARRIGLEAQTIENVRVSLSQTSVVDLRLGQAAVRLEGVIVTAQTSGADIGPSRQGSGQTTVGDSLISRLPTLDRDFTDLVKLSPQVASPGSGGPSAGGAYNRLNNFTIDGANQNDRFNLGSSEGTPGGATGGRLISIEAVKEFQVLLAPTDVRQGNFGGALVNAVTQNGTNTLTGGATYTFRTPGMAYDTAFVRNSGLDVRQYGFHLGGPIIRDRLHFFVAPEFQERTNPASGPFYLSRTATGVPNAAAPDTVFLIDSLVRSRLGYNPGALGQVPIENPLRNFFGRLDLQLNEGNRLVFRQLVNRAERTAFSRGVAGYSATIGTQVGGYRLGSNGFTSENRNNSSVLQLFSSFASGASNEFFVGYNTIRDARIPTGAPAPEISVGTVGVGAASVNTAVTFGAEQFSTGNRLEQNITEVVNNFTIPVGSHSITVGGRFEHTSIFNQFPQQALGVYRFGTVQAFRNVLDNPATARPTAYAISYANGGPLAADFGVRQYSAYAQDQWAVTPTFTVTAGLRGDMPDFGDAPARNANLITALDTAGLDLDNSAIPKRRVLWSPRAGFNFRPGNSTTQIRGNVGVFTATAPFILLANAYQNTGLGYVTLGCSAAGSVPAFTLNVDSLPRACAGQSAPTAGNAGTSGLNVNDPNFRYPQNFTATLGFDRQFLGFNMTVEGLYRRAMNGLFVENVNFKGPRTGTNRTDRYGRVQYTNTNETRYLTAYRGVNFTDGVIQVSNQSEDYNYSLSGQLRRRFGGSLEFGTSYTYTQAKDVQSLTSDRAISNWRNGRVVGATGHEGREATTSYFERPHRVMLNGTYTAPWKKFATDISMYYEGISGTPLAYVSNGDLNGDGQPDNDAFYIPKNATDTTEVRIGRGSGAAFALNTTDAQALERFIASQECLSSQRGQIMERNSCRSPFQHRLDLSLRQTLPEILGQRLSAQLDVFNFLNFVNKEWGRIRLPAASPDFPQQQLAAARGANAAGVSQFEFNGAVATQGAYVVAPNRAGNLYQMQLTFRYSF